MSRQRLQISRKINIFPRIRQIPDSKLLKKLLNIYFEGCGSRWGDQRVMATLSMKLDALRWGMA